MDHGVQQLRHKLSRLINGVQWFSAFSGVQRCSTVFSGVRRCSVLKVLSSVEGVEGVELLFSVEGVEGVERCSV